MDAVETHTSDPPQNVESIVSTVEVCRVCLLENPMMRDLFLESEVASLSVKAMSFTNVKMIPGDGLPPRICCVCADKLESAYEFKLQVEQADSFLREKYDSLNSIKEELFFNEVEVHLDNDRNNGIEDINVEAHYESTDSSQEQGNEKSSLLKDEFVLLEKVESLADDHNNLQRHSDRQSAEEETNEVIDIAEKLQNELSHSEETNIQVAISMGESKDCCKEDNANDSSVDVIRNEEHDYIMQQECEAPNEQLLPEESSACDQTDIQYSNPVSQNSDNIESQLDATEEEPCILKLELQPKHDSSPSEMRRSKRKSARRLLATERDSDEENYFENLNLSSRLKKIQADKSEKVYYMCYLCDKQFLSKNVLKEHMHSHEEVRKTLSLKKTPEKAQNMPTTSTKMPPSGKKANKCPYCGKEYLYIISFSKHLKQHEKEKEDSMPLEVSFEEDDQSLDFDSYANSQYSDSECKKRTRSTGDEDDNEGNSESQTSKKKAPTVTYSCEKCSENFNTKRSLRKHSVTHMNLKCNVCDEEFETLEKLRNHRTTHVMEGVLSNQDLEEDIKDLGTFENVNGEDDEEDNDDDVNEDEKATETRDLKCPECPMTFPHKKSLARHMETHTGMKYSCKVCRQEFNRKDQLRRHAEQHGKVKTFKCTQCGKVFGNELTLRNHLIATNHKTIVHGEEYDPNKRIKRVAAKAAQKIIDKIKTEDGLEDYDEDDRDDDSVEFTTGRRGLPRRSGNKKELECATCNKKCTSKQSLMKHMEQHVKDEEKALKSETPDKQKKIADKKEEQISSAETRVDDDDDDNSDFESGLEWPMDNHECTICKKKYSTKKSLLRHQLLHEAPNFECDICNVKFYRKDKLKAHYDKCSEKNPDQVRKCNICGDSFENNDMLKEHRAKHVTEGILTEEDLRDIEPRPEEKKSGQKIARKRRTDIVGLECTECNKQYTSRKGLLRHIQVHEGKKYLCDICPKKFYRREHLKIHVAKHNMIKPYKCTRCTKRFIKEEQLTNHLSKHDRTFKKNKETDSSKRFLCEICSKSFTQSTTLIAHLRAHNGIKPYVCEVCSRPFTTNAYLKMHMRTHTQERPYICQYCSRAFARADTLANHLTSHTGEAKYHCKYCPKNFRRLKSLKEHVFIHTGQRPYACPTCDRRFNNNGSRYAHSKRCKQNFLQNQNRQNQSITQVQPPPQQRMHQTLAQTQIVKAQNIKTITITRQAEPIATQQVMQHQEILMPLILPLTVTLTDVGEEVILPEGTKIFTTT